MSTFTYEALDGDSKETSGTIKATSKSEAIKQLRNKGLFPTKVRIPEDEIKTGTKTDVNIDDRAEVMGSLALSIIFFTVFFGAVIFGTTKSSNWIIKHFEMGLLGKIVLYGLCVILAYFLLCRLIRATRNTYKKGIATLTSKGE